MSYLQIKTHRISELELGFQLDHSWCIVARCATQDAGWRCRLVKYLAKSLVLDLIVGKTKIRMVKEVEELEANSNRCFLPPGDLRTLHDAEVGIEVAWPSKAIAPLCNLYGGSTAGA